MTRTARDVELVLVSGKTAQNMKESGLTMSDMVTASLQLMKWNIQASGIQT